MNRKINSELFLESSICLILGILLFYAILSGTVSLYVHPRLNGFLWVTAAALVAIALFMFPHAFTPKHNARPTKYLLFLLPLLASLLIPAGAVQSKAVSFGGSAAGGSPAGGIASGQKAAAASDSASSQDNSGAWVRSSPSSSAADAELPKEDENGVMTVTDEGFAKWYQDINQDMEKYEGKTLKFKGQVFRMEGFAKNEIVPVRYAMVCCTADLQPCGILSRSNEVTKYKNNEWVWVTGKIKIEEYQGQTMPVCYVTKIEPADKAKEAYIYFTY